jgi:hypothetical protein
MAQMVQEFRDDADDADDEDVADFIAHFELLTSEKIKKVHDGAKVTLKKKENDERVVVKNKEKEEMMKALNGNSADNIAELEKEYDFTNVPFMREREETKKWYKADRPSSSRLHGPTVSSAYTVWLKWNPISKGGKSHNYKGDLVRKREDESGAAM